MQGNAGWWYVYDLDGNDQLIFNHRLPSPMSEPNWHPTDKDLYRYFPYNGGSTIREYNVVSRTDVLLVDFANRLPWSNVSHIWTKEEGRPSADGNVWCLMAEDQNYQTVGIFSYSMETNDITGTLSLSEDPDHISTSVSGDYCVPSSNGPMGTRAYSLDFTSHTQLLFKSEHSDLALDSNNKDVFVVADYSSPQDGGWIKMVDLETGSVTRLINLYQTPGTSFSAHISGIAHQLPGYFVLSTYAAVLDYGNVNANYGDLWSHDKLAVVELKANPVIYNIAYMHNKMDGYFTEPQATPNPDLTKIIFASTWEQADISRLGSYLVSMTDSGDLIFASDFEN